MVRIWNKDSRGWRSDGLGPAAKDVGHDAGDDGGKLHGVPSGPDCNGVWLVPEGRRATSGIKSDYRKFFLLRNRRIWRIKVTPT